MKPKTLTEQFWDKVVIGSDCWKWLASKRVGYGVVGVKGKAIGAHRVSWMIHFGEIPKGMHVLHKCDNRECTNPQHLFLGTNLDNIRDRQAKKRSIWGERHKFSKLHDADVLIIKQRLAAGNKQAHIARDFGVCKTTINEIAMGRNWKYLEVQV